MAVDMNVFRKLVKAEINSLANEEYLRNLWFGNIPGYVGSPDESFCMFFDTAIEELLELPDTGFSEKQQESLRHLTKLMRNLNVETENFLPPTFIDDPRWQKVMAAAKETKKLLDV